MASCKYRNASECWAGSGDCHEFLRRHRHGNRDSGSEISTKAAPTSRRAPGLCQKDDARGQIRDPRIRAQLAGGGSFVLRTDITAPSVVDAWIEDLRKGNTVTLLAEGADRIAGYASVHRDEARWTRRVGEVRINAATGYRGAGLGRALAAEIFEVARSLGLKKMAAMMTQDQTGARTAFERLGFTVEAMLTDWVEDRRGHPRDLLVMSYDVAGFTDQATASSAQSEDTRRV